MESVGAWAFGGEAQVRNNPGQDRIYRKQIYGEEVSEADARVIDRLEGIAAAQGVAPAQVALAWLLQRPGVMRQLSARPSRVILKMPWRRSRFAWPRRQSQPSKRPMFRTPWRAWPANSWLRLIPGFGRISVPMIRCYFASRASWRVRFSAAQARELHHKRPINRLGTS